ncbi:MAG: MFS transporter [Clostridiales bacterium]|nr:MFS transporter [Clostridiales bacterium]
MRSLNFGKKGWYIIIFTLLIYWFSSTPADVLNVTVDGFALRFGMDSTNSLLIFAAVGGFVGIPLALVTGHIVSKKGVKKPGIILMIIMGVIWIIYGRCSTFMQYAVIATIISAISNVVNLVITQQIMSNWFPRKKGLALGWATMGMPLDSAVTVAVFQVLIVRFGLSAPFYMMFVITIALAVVMILTVKEYPEQANAFPDNEPITEEQRQENIRLFDEYKSPYTVKKLFVTKDFWLLIITFGFLFIGLLGAITQMIPRLTSIGFDTNTAVMWLTIASLVGIPASFVWGAVDQAIGTKKTVIVFSVIWTVMMLIATVGCGTMSMPVTICSLVMLSCLHGGLGNLMPSMVISIFGRYDFAQVNKMVIPFVVGIRTLSFIIIPVVLAMAGAGNEALGYRNVYAIFTVLAVIALICSTFLSSKMIGKK